MSIVLGIGGKAEHGKSAASRIIREYVAASERYGASLRAPNGTNRLTIK